MKQTTHLYGFHSVESTIQNNPKSIKNIYIDKNRRDKRIKNLIKLVQENKLKVSLVDERFFKDFKNKNHQGVVVEYEKSKNYTEKDFDSFLKENLNKENLLILVLDEIQDPHNLGAIIRTANATGVDVIIAPKDKAVGITPVVHKVSAGAVEKTPFIQVTNLSQTLKKLKKENIWVYGFSGEAKKTIYDMDLKGRVTVVMGSEGKGLRRLTQENCDELLKIPMVGQVESLNVSVATGVVLYEVLKQNL